MIKTIYIIAVAVALMASPPVSRAQQADAPKPTLTAKLKQKYLEQRAKFVGQVKHIYFAVGCKILPNDAGTRSLARRDRDLANIREQVVLDLKEDQELVEAAKQEGLDRAAKPGACDYYRRHPEAAEAARREAAGADKPKQ
jgi:Tfp pilus assembly protein PilW